MDYRNSIVTNVLMALVKHGVDQSIIDEMKFILYQQLDQYEVLDRCTDVTTIDVSAYMALGEFLKVKKIEGKSDTTIKRYMYELNHLFEFYHKALSEYTTSDIRSYLAYRKTHSPRNGHLSDRTLDGMRKCYSSFFQWITSERIIPWNPCISVGQIKYRKTVKLPYSSIELQKLREACETRRDIALIDFLSVTGCRVGEVANVQMTDIDWANRSVLVTGKGNKQRIVYMTDVCIMHLQEYISGRNDYCAALFVSNCGKPLTIGGIQVAVKRIGNRAGVENVHCHRFRHTLASYLATRIPITELAAILGHASLDVTSQYVSCDKSSIASNYQKAMIG